MDTNSRIEQEISADGDSGRVHARLESLRGDWRQLRNWRWTRVAAAGIAAATAAAVVVSLNGMMTVAGAAWWNVLIVATGSLLAGLVVGSYIGAPIGADATVCDTRWPLLGLTGLVVATSTGQATLAADLFTGASPRSAGRGDPARFRTPLPGPVGLGIAGAPRTRAEGRIARRRWGCRRCVHYLPAALSRQAAPVRRPARLMAAGITDGCSRARGTGLDGPGRKVSLAPFHDSSGT